MKIFLPQKLFLTLVCLSLFSEAVYAWSGYDYENKTEVDIGTGNLVREGLIIQFYDSKDDNFHTAKIAYIESVAGGTRIQLTDLDTGQERTFIMQSD